MKRLALALMFLSSLLTSCPGRESETPAPPVGSISGAVFLPGSIGSSAITPHNSGVTTPPSPKASAVVEGEYLISFKPTMTAQGLGRLSLQIGEKSLTLTRLLWAPAVKLGLYRVVENKGVDPASIESALQNFQHVASVSPNSIVHVNAIPNDPLYPLQWHYEAMNLPKAWDITTGNGIVVAVVDTGITPNEDFSSKILPGIDMIMDPSNGDGDGIDLDPTDLGTKSHHGTHVAGTIAASSNNGKGVAGVSWGARILPVRALSENGGTAAAILYGILWAAGEQISNLPVNRNPARIINLSLSAPNTSCSQDYNDVLGYVTSKNIVVVASAGNDKVDAATATPANCPQPIVVAASTLSGGLAPYSNDGSRIDIIAPGGNLNEVFGSGCQGPCPAGVLSTDYDFGSNRSTVQMMQGTSMAAPHVSGAAALYLSVVPNATPAQVRAAMRSAARPLLKACTRACGPGVLDVAALLSGSGQAKPTLPPAQSATLYIAALYQLGTQLDPERSVMVSRTDSRLRQPYVMQKLSYGTYVMVAWIDSDGDKLVDASEPFGFYDQKLNIDSYRKDFYGIDFGMASDMVTGQGNSKKAEVVQMINEYIGQTRLLTH